MHISFYIFFMFHVDVDVSLIVMCISRNKAVRIKNLISFPPPLGLNYAKFQY